MNAKALDREIDALPSDNYETVNAHQGCTALAVNSLGNQIATGGIDNCVKLWSTRDMKKEIAILKT